jgi:hypothetical protein
VRRLPLAVIVVVAALIAACGSGGGKKSAGESFATAPPTTVAADTRATGPSTTTRPPDLTVKSFRSPSSNIGCGVDAAATRCDIRQRSWSPPPKPASCDLDWGNGVQVSGDGPGGFACAGDTVFDPAAPVLAYGQRTRQGSTVCESAEAGVTCTNEASGHGFFLSRERYRLF